MVTADYVLHCDLAYFPGDEQVFALRVDLDDLAADGGAVLLRLVERPPLPREGVPVSMS